MSRLRRDSREPAAETPLAGQPRGVVGKAPRTARIDARGGDGPVQRKPEGEARAGAPSAASHAGPRSDDALAGAAGAMPYVDYIQAAFGPANGEGETGGASGGVVQREAADDQPRGEAGAGKALRKVYTVGKQKVLVFVSPKGITSPTPDVFIHFHGHRANYGIDGQTEHAGNLAGSDVVAATMAGARANLVAIMPQGVAGESDEWSKEGGHMRSLARLGLPAFVQSALDSLAPDVGEKSLAPGNISISGHSAGGYQGTNDALRTAGGLADNITEVTLMDSGYSLSHFNSAASWLMSGKPGKSLRILGQARQIGKRGKGTHHAVFAPEALDRLAVKHGATVTHLVLPDPKAEDAKADRARAHESRLEQHSQIFIDGQLHADVLILQTGPGHEKLRDDFIDDAVLGTGAGTGGTDAFGATD